MYFPKGFKRHLSVELGNLVVYSYSLFRAFEENSLPEKLPSQYSNLMELFYTEKKGKGGKLGSKLAHTIGVESKKLIPASVPIGFVAESKKNVFLIFRGTRTTKEWLNNISISFTEYPDLPFGKVHDGFLSVYKTIRDDILKAIEKTSPKKKLLVAGHSLGAALATMAVPDISFNLHRKIKAVYTYGSPRVGDDTFAASYNAHFARITYRIVNTSDIITSLPLPIPVAGMLGGYFSHVDTPVDFTVQEEDWEKNHDMSCYLLALGKAK